MTGSWHLLCVRMTQDERQNLETYAASMVRVTEWTLYGAVALWKKSNTFLVMRVALFSVHPPPTP